MSYNETEHGIVSKIISEMKGNNASAADAFATAAGQGLAKKVIDNQTSSKIFGQFGLARNPNLEILFSRPEFRTFDFSFSFLPRNEKESETIQRMVLMFKKYSHPEPLTQDTTNAFWKFPDVFIIRLNNPMDEEGKKIPFKTKKCVLESVEVVYESSDGLSQFNDGFAVQTNLNLRFKEIVSLTRKDIETGY